MLFQSSIFGGSSWEYRKERRKYYFHHFLAEQPDLNLRNENVKREIKVNLPPIKVIASYVKVPKFMYFMIYVSRT